MWILVLFFHQDRHALEEMRRADEKRENYHHNTEDTHGYFLWYLFAAIMIIIMAGLVLGLYLLINMKFKASEENEERNDFHLSSESVLECKVESEIDNERDQDQC